MSDLEVATADVTHVFQESDVVTIGRRDDNTVILADPTVSRQHVVIRFESGGWVLEDLTGGRTFYGGGPVARLSVTQATQTINLGSPSGPWLAVAARGHEEVAPAGQVGADSLAGRPGEDTAAVGVVSGHAGMSALSASSAPPQWTAFRPGAAAPGAWPSAGGPAVQAGVRRGGAINADQLKRALHILFPFRSWIDNAGWRSGVRLMFLVYAMLPVVFVVAFFNTTNFQTLGWVYAIYTAPIWLLAFWWLIKPEDPKRTLLIAGAVIGVIVLLVMAGPLQWYYNAIPDPSLTPGDWFSWLIAPGFAEELTKDGPVLLTVLAAGYFFKHRLGVRSCMFLGTVAGLVFGAREAALYQDKDLNLFNGSSGPHALVQYVLEFSLRIFTDGLQHAEWAGIACFFIGLGLNYTRRRIPLILFGFGFGAVLHATNDWSTGESRWLWLFLQVFSAALFLGYTLFAPSIEAQVRDTSLFRGESMLAEQVPRDEQGNPIAPGPAGHPS